MLDTIAWSKPSTYTTGTGVHHGYSTAPAPQEALPYPDRPYPHDGSGQPGYRLIRVEKLWYAKLDPGGFIVPHVDQGPWVERWHYPINGRGSVWQEWNPDDDDRDPHFRFLTMRISTVDSAAPYRMNHHKPHAVWNPHTEPRIILIVEYDNSVDQPTTGLIICDMIPEVQAMIDAI